MKINKNNHHGITIILLFIRFGWSVDLSRNFFGQTFSFSRCMYLSIKWMLNINSLLLHFSPFYYIFASKGIVTIWSKHYKQKINKYYVKMWNVNRLEQSSALSTLHWMPSAYAWPFRCIYILFRSNARTEETLNWWICILCCNTQDIMHKKCMQIIT